MNEIAGEVSTEWLPPIVLEQGAFNTRSLVRTGKSVRFVSSRSNQVFAWVLLIVGVLLLFGNFPSIDAFVPTWAISLVFFAGAAGLLFAAWFVNQLFRVEFDFETNFLLITALGELRHKIPFDGIVGLQFLETPVEGGQLNVVFRSDDGDLDRVCLHAAQPAKHAQEVAQQAEELLPWSVF